MNEKDKWSVHVEYLKLAIALSTALIAAGAGIYSDTSKIPTGVARYFFLAAAVAIFLTLFFSLMSAAALSNHMVYATSSQPPAQPNARARGAVFYANLSFSFLAVGVLFLVIFFGVRTFSVGEPSFDRSLTAATAIAAKQINAAKGETLVLKSADHGADGYTFVFQAAPTPETVTVETDTRSEVVKSSRR